MNADSVMEAVKAQWVASELIELLGSGPAYEDVLYRSSTNRTTHLSAIFCPGIIDTIFLPGHN
jgi:hypothetical protein